MTAYIYATAGQKVYQYDPSDMSKVAETAAAGGGLRALTALGGYIYAGGNSPLANKVFQYDPSDMSKVAESLAYNGFIIALAEDGSNIYNGGALTDSIYKYDPSDLSKVAESDDYGTIYDLTVLAAHIYAAGVGAEVGFFKVLQYLRSDLSTVAESLSYGGIMFGLAALGGFVFAGGQTTQKLFKYDPSDMSKVAESADYGGAIRSLDADDSNLYAGGFTTQKVFKYNPANLAKLAESGDYGSFITAIAGYGNYIYAGGGGGQKVFQYNRSDLSKVAETLTHGSTVTRLLGFEVVISVPTVTTQAVSNIGETTATANGNITDLGTPNPTAHGFAYSPSDTTPDIETDSVTDEGAASSTGAFTSDLTGLTAGLLYYVRAYATNTAGTSYGSVVTVRGIRAVGAGYVWQDGPFVHFGGEDGNEVIYNPPLTVSGSEDPGYLWTEGTELNVIDSAGDERSEEGTATGDTGPEGTAFIEASELHYLDAAAGAERTH